MPIEFKQLQQPTGSSDKNLFKLTMSYDGSGRRISKTRWVKNAGSQDWEKELVTHYTGIGTEIREDFTKNQTKVVVNMPEGFGRYGVEDASGPDMGFGAGYIPNTKFEWYLKNHLGSTMLVYGTQANAAGGVLENKLEPIAAYDYRAFGEMVELTPPATGKVTENFTSSRFARRTQRTACKSIAEPKNLGAKRNEHDDEIALDYFGARYLDPMLGMWISVDPARQFASPYLYAGNGVNPVNGVDPDGNTTLKLNEDNTVAGKYDDGNLDKVSVFKADGSLFGEYNAPPAESYFNTEDLINLKFDPDMERNVAVLMSEAWHDWPCGVLKWASDKPFDFKHRFYTSKGMSEFTVGFLNNTIMTARDVGNAIWGGWTRQAYIEFFVPLNLFTPSIMLPKHYYHNLGMMKIISNVTALIFDKKLEDEGSAAMQRWGFDNYVP
jgi:RHS repeat-associated protein